MAQQETSNDDTCHNNAKTKIRNDHEATEIDATRRRRLYRPSVVPQLPGLDSHGAVFEATGVHATELPENMFVLQTPEQRDKN